MLQVLFSDSFVMISKYFNVFSMYSDFKMYTYVSQEYYQLMKQYLDEGVPVEGLGVEGHVKPYLPLDAALIWVLIAFSLDPGIFISFSITHLSRGTLFTLISVET